MKKLILLLAALWALPVFAQTSEDTGAVILYTIVVAATPDRLSVASVTMTSQAYLNEASCRNAQEWFKSQVPNSPLYGVSTNSWCTIKVPF
jgi:hypothetical protein